MTCVVGLLETGGLYFGADRYAGYGGTIYLADRPKVWKSGPYLFGMAGNMSTSNLVRYHFPPPDIEAAQGGDDFDLDTFMCGEFAFQLRAFMKEQEVLLEDSDEEEGGKFMSFAGSALVGIRRRLYVVDQSCSVFPVLGNYAAIGAARDVALGVLYGLEHSGELWTIRTHVLGTEDEAKLAEKKVKLALQATVDWTDYTRGPFDVITDKQ